MKHPIRISAFLLAGALATTAFAGPTPTGKGRASHEYTAARADTGKVAEMAKSDEEAKSVALYLGDTKPVHRSMGRTGYRRSN